MTHAVGTRLDGLADVESMRLRCVCDADSGCWHLRSSHGKQLKRGRPHMVWVYGIGPMTATRAMWQFHSGKPVPDDRVVLRRCESFDCVNPAHLRCGRRADVVRLQVKRGSFKSERCRMQRRAARSKTCKLTPELRQWAIESPQSGVAAAHGLGVAQQTVAAIRSAAMKRMQNAAPSVFAFGEAMNHAMRRAA